MLITVVSTKAAVSLNVSPRTLSRWLRDYDLQDFASELRKKNKVPGPRSF